MSAAEILGRHPAVAEATQDGDGLLVRLRPGQNVPDGHLLAFLRRELPEQQLPGCIRVERDADVRRETGLWTLMARAWKAELGRQPAEHDRFIDSGGDSLAAVRFVHVLAGVLGRPLSLSEVMPLLLRHDFASLVGAFELIREAATDSSLKPEGTADQSGDRYAPFPLTDQQQAYVLGRQQIFASGELPCHTYVEFDGTGLDLEAFRAAWRVLFARHDALGIGIDAETLTQRVQRSPEFDPVTVYEVEQADVDGDLAELRAALSHRIAPLDGPLIDIVVALLPDGRQRICIGIDALIADLASSAVLFDELAALYRDRDRNQLEALDWSFREHVLAEVAATTQRRHHEARDYWHRRIETLPDAPELPLAVDPARITQPRFTNRLVRLDRQRWSRLRAVAAAESITPSVLLVTAYAEVIGMWARSPRFTLNLPSFNRRPHHREVDQVVGEFASFTLVEVDLTQGENFLDRARVIQRQLWEDLSHQEYGGIAVLREFVRQRRQHGRAVMPIVFTGATMFDHNPAILLDGAFERTYRLSKTPQVWLDLIVEEADGELLLNWDALDELFPSGLIEQMARSLADVLERLADGEVDPEINAPAADLALFERVAGEQRSIPDEPVHAAFERHAIAEPDALAVITDERRLTRAELLALARALSRKLVGLGAAQSAPVAIMMPRGWRVAVAAYAATYAGAPYLPIDPQLPAERAAQLLKRSGAVALLGDGSAASHQIATSAGVVWLAVDDIDPLHSSESEAFTARVAAPDDLCFLLPTSGTTGQPKLAMIEHRAVVNCVRETTRTFSIGPTDRVFALTALHHDMSAFDLFGVLGAGGCLVIPHDARDPWTWAELVDRHEVSIWNSVPASLEMVLETQVALEQLRLVFCGGDWVRPALVRQLRHRVPDARFVSVGGPTETTIWNIWHEVAELDPHTAHIPYGRAIANARYHVLDERARQRPVGAIGELCCTGQTLARGYLDDLCDTRQQFTQHPDTAQRMYRTGDLGRFMPNGDIEFIGRVDHQLKVRGRRIEPGEIEQAIVAHPEVTAAVVTGIPSRDGRGHRALAAHVSPAVPDGLEQWLGTRVAPYHVPSVFVAISRMPLTANGKVNRAALKLPDDLTAVTVPPQGALETVLAQIWSRLLRVEQVGRDDDFFRLGGDSLVATRLIAAVRQTLPGSNAGLRALFQGPTVAAMAATLGDRESFERVAQLYLDVQRMPSEQVELMLKERKAAHDQV